VLEAGGDGSDARHIGLLFKCDGTRVCGQGHKWITRPEIDRAGSVYTMAAATHNGGVKTVHGYAPPFRAAFSSQTSSISGRTGGSSSALGKVFGGLLSIWDVFWSDQASVARSLGDPMRGSVNVDRRNKRSCTIERLDCKGE